jgi:glycosyltransferase involved in cell wall biosynthesis
MSPEVSVVIPTYNRRAMVREAVASALAQREVEFELIVVDDGSTDGTADELERVAAQANGENAEHRRMRVVRTANRGVAAARNTGAALASAPLIALLDSDDLWLPQKLERQVASMRADPQCVISQTEELWLRGERRVNPGLRHRKRGGDIFLDSLRTCLISPSAVIMRTALLREIGGFDERMAAAEDYDLWLRILARHQVGLLAETLTVRRAGYSVAGVAGQLSATVPAIDRFRIVALLKVLAVGDLDAPRRQAVSDVLAEKCAIYAQGLRRRGRDTAAAAVARLGARAIGASREEGGDADADATEPMIAIMRESPGAMAESDA